MLIVSIGDILHEMSNPVFWEKKENYFEMSSAKNFTQSVMRQCHFWLALLQFEQINVC